MKEAEARGRALRVLGVERGDALLRDGDEPSVALHVLGVGVGEVAEEGKVDVVLEARERPNLEIREQLLHRLRAVEHGRDDDEGARGRRNAVVEGELGQDARRQDEDEDRVRQRDGHLARRKDEDRDEEREDPAREHRVAGPCRPGAGADGQDGERAEVEERRVRLEESLRAKREAATVAELDLERAPPAIDEPVAHVGRGRVLSVGLRLSLGEPERGLRDVDLDRLASARELLDRVAIAVARAVVHRAVDSRRIAREDALDRADAGEEGIPVDGTDGAHARDRVPDRHLIGRLPEVLAPRELRGCGAQLRASRMETRDDGAEGRLVVAQTAEQLDHEGGARSLRARLEGLEEGGDARLRVAVVDEALGPPVRTRAISPIGGRRREGAYGQDEADAEHDGHRPKLADRQRRHALVREDVARERGEIDARVGVAQVVDAQPVDARVSAHRAGREAGKLDEVAPRQILLDLAELILHDVAVVEQPLLRGDRLSLRVTKVIGQPRVRVANAGASEHQPGPQRPRGHTRRGDAVRARDVDGMLDETLDGVNLTSESVRLVPSLVGVEARARHARPQRDA